MNYFKPGDLVFYDRKIYSYSSKFPGSKEKFESNVVLVIKNCSAYNDPNPIYNIFLNGKVQAVFVTNLRQIH